MKCKCKMIFTGTKRKLRDYGRESGQSATDEYKIWAGIRSRCNPKTKMGSNKYYTGIRISEDWARTFFNFRSDMGIRPGKRYSVDRRDNARGYCKHNCRWATKHQQVLNRRCTVNSNMPLGVRKLKSGNYVARISLLGRMFQLGTFSTKKRAISEYERFSKYFETPDTELL